MRKLMPAVCMLERSPERGATLVEFAMVFPVIVIIIFGMIDFTRYVAVKDALEVAARQALTYAAIVPDLERPAKEEGENQGRYELALLRVANRAREVRHHPLFTSSVRLEEKSDAEIVTVPENPLDPKKDRETALAATPVEVRLSAQFSLIALPWMAKLPVSALAVGYREPRLFASNPIALDCEGKPFLPGNYSLTCNCAADMHVNYEKGACECNACPAGMIRKSGSCACDCPEPFVKNSSGACACEAELAQECADKGFAFNMTTCKCTECVAPQVYDPITKQCVCPQLVNNPDYNCGTGAGGIILQLDPVTCTCECNSWNATQNSDGECECAAPTKVVDGYCACPTASEICNVKGQVVVNRSCECVCPPEQIVNADGSACVCGRTCGSNQVQDPETCECTCKACPTGQILEPATCSCSCPRGTSWDEQTQQCECNITCPAGSHRTSAPTCNCECDSPNQCPNWEDGIFMGCDDCGE